MGKRCNFAITKRLRLGGFFLALLMLIGSSIWLLNFKSVSAYEGDYWTTEDESGLSVTVVSVEQNGIVLEPVYGEGEVYFNVANNTDTLRVGLLVDGMASDASYYYYESDNYWMGRRDLTYLDNGTTIYQDLRPWFHCATEDNCYYYVGAGVSKVNGIGVQKDIIVHPTSVGSHSIDILSVKQNNVDLALTNNEYQITDYDTPVSVTYKLKNLEIGKLYSVEVGRSEYYQFRATTTEVTATKNLSLDLVSKHINNSIYLYDNDGSEQVNLYFMVADNDFKPLGDIIISGISQGGTELTAVEDTSGWQRTYTFTPNDAQGLRVGLYATMATDDIDYYISYSMSGSGESYSSSESILVSGDELWHGTYITIPAAFGMSDNSPYRLWLYINTTGASVYSSGMQSVVYKDYAEPQNNSDVLYFDFFVDENVPRYDAAMYYSNGVRIESNIINPLLHDEDDPLLLEVHGERYDNATVYDVTTKVRANGETYYSQVFQATGAELNEGTVFGMTGLTLALPEFDPTGGTSGYELAYDFSLSIDGLEQHGEMLYMYDGWMVSSMTYNNGEVVSMGSGGGIAGDYYTTMNAATIRKSSLSGDRGATIHYIANGFDPSLFYDYKIYYNGNAGEQWWSEPAGTLIVDGGASGNELNENGISLELTAPSNESVGEMYTLVITHDGDLVRIARDSLIFTDDPKIESFKFTADNDSYMQTGRTSYRLARGTNVDATLTGDGFTDDAEYKVWVSYNGYHYGEPDEHGESYPEYVNLSALDTSVIVTGAQLNAGYTYDLDYVEAIDAVHFMEVDFAISDKDANKPEWYGDSGDGSYSGHSIHIDLVDQEEVFHGDGYHVNEDGTITDVSEPDEPGRIPVDNRAPGEVEVHVEDDTTLVMVASKPTLIIGLKDGHYQLIAADTSIDDEGTKTNSYDIEGFEEIKVVLKGDGDMNGSVSSSDVNLITRSLIGDSLPPHRNLTELEQIILDVTGDGFVTSADTNRITRSLIGPAVPAYLPLGW